MIFFMSDVRPGIGPFLAIYLKSFLHWNPEHIGFALGALDMTASLCQIPSGLLVDAVKFKRFLIFAACTIISIACYIILSDPTFKMVLFAQSMIGVAAAIIPPCIQSITLGLFKLTRFPKRVSINETWNHFGNVITASCAGLMGYWLGAPWIMIMVIIFAWLCIFSLIFINPKEIDHAAARSLATIDEHTKPISIWTYLRKTPILIFCCSVFLFYFANAAQLQLIGQIVSQKDVKISSLFIAGGIVWSQFIMIGVAYSLGFLINYIGRKPIFILSFVVLALRAILYTLTTDPLYFLLIQTLDGVGAGILGVMGIVIISDISKGSGRFNFSIGMMALSQGLGSTASNVMSGLIVQNFGFNLAFYVLASIAAVGFCFFGFLMPETKKTA